MWLINGCSFVYGDELENPEETRWTSILGDLAHRSIVNIAEGGSSNAKIYRDTFNYLIENHNNIDTAIVMWSAFERVEFASVQYHHTYKEDGLGGIRFRTNDFFMQASPARLDNVPALRKNRDQWYDFYGCLWSAEHGIATTVDYMWQLSFLCNTLGIKLYQTWFDSQMRYLVARTFSPQRMKHNPEVFMRPYNYIMPKLDSLPDQEKIGCVDDNGVTFYEMARDKGYKINPGGHPAEEGHAAYARYIYSIVSGQNDDFRLE